MRYFFDPIRHVVLPPYRMWSMLAGAAIPLAALLAFSFPSIAATSDWSVEWPDTDFSRHSVDLGSILSGGPPRDGIRSIDKPEFAAVGRTKNLADSEPVISITVNGDTRAYPLRIIIWHEIVNDTIGGLPVVVTFCPLCNSSIVFDRRVDGRVLDFGTTGKLRNSDLVMYDRQSESWWQQFLGQGIVGEMTGRTLKMLPSRVESFASFRSRVPNGMVLVPNDPRMRRYGDNPYVGYDGSSYPFLYQGDMPDGIEPMARVIVVNGEAWSLSLLRRKGEITSGDIKISWRPGQNSALDTRRIEKGRDIGNVTVLRTGRDAVYDVTFAFAFHAFYPTGIIHVK